MQGKDIGVEGHTAESGLTKPHKGKAILEAEA